MADEHDLKSLYEGVDASADEMARYRARLGERLDESTSHVNRWLALAASAAAAILIWVLLVPSPPGLEQESLEDLQSLVATSDHDRIESVARQAGASTNELARYNANMLLCLTSPDGGALEEAARGATTDPRAEFRAWYLEYLLDNADSYELDPDGIEETMEIETDATCLKLYSRLLHLAEKGASITA